MTTQSQPKTRRNYFIAPEMLARMKEHMQRTGITESEFVRRAIEEALKKVGSVVTRQS
jgi:predicted DNA-binding protein